MSCSRPADRSAERTAPSPGHRTSRTRPRGIHAVLPPCARAWPPPDRSGSAVDRSATPWSQRTTVPPPRRRTPHRSRGRQACGPETPSPGPPIAASRRTRERAGEVGRRPMGGRMRSESHAPANSWSGAYERRQGPKSAAIRHRPPFRRRIWYAGSVPRERLRGMLTSGVWLYSRSVTRSRRIAPLPPRDRSASGAS
jgi:hypothetical protein